jgi:hypothetical protein
MDMVFHPKIATVRDFLIFPRGLEGVENKGNLGNFSAFFGQLYGRRCFVIPAHAGIQVCLRYNQPGYPLTRV